MTSGLTALGTTLVLLVTFVTLAAVRAAGTGPEAAGHLVDLAKAILSLPLFASATLVWTLANYREEIRGALAHNSRRSTLSDAAAADAAALSRVSAHAAGVDAGHLGHWLEKHGWEVMVIDQLLERGWIEPTAGSSLVLSDRGRGVLLQWQERMR